MINKDTYKRFTELKTYNNGKKMYVQYSVSGCYNDMNRKGDYTTGDSVDRLAELEDKIESGTLIELPCNCKIGDLVYGVADFLSKPKLGILTCVEITKYCSRMRNDRKTLEKMAEYIMNSRAERCSECCANFKACNARFAEDENVPSPTDEFCIKNIIKFFENEVNNESDRD